ncbi:transmembrane protein 199 [Exaiptasia diaphana]|uniref:Transmembrane protein 199 n=1 Tax=Exaiptasia diaphana TaxID=2652724 RepID=A0A913X7F5_EXADI|nr:transmembrane protein 199 [Exaiptasia diaphana]KXJ26850.1 Transmembrane protein 199 [Exaiptasia diaphana]
MVVNVLLTRRIQKAIVDVQESGETPKELSDRLSEYCSKDLDGNKDKEASIEFSLVREVWQLLKKNSFRSGEDKLIYLHELLEGSEVYVSPPKPPERNPELVARLKKLQAQQDRLKYDAMVSNLGPKYDAAKELGTEVRTTSKQLSSIFNFLVSIAAAFVFGFIASQYAFPNLGMRVIIGIIMACVVAIADIYFMARTEI